MCQSQDQVSKRQRVHLAADHGAAPGLIGELGRGDADRLEPVIERLDQVARHEVTERRLVHHRDRRDVARHDPRAQLIVVRAPLDDLGLDHDVVRVRGVELVDDRRDDPALAAGLLDVRDLAVLGLARPEEPG